ncbi:MAG: hypothetical protein HKN91_11475 [Acidimicrobiia bacterium]|nr:hypothetical protein [Acidimicrobiia bacterium]
MNPTTHEPDDRLLQELGSALDNTDPVPERFIEAAKESFTWRTIDIELAELVFDSAESELVGVRGVDATRQVTFQAPGFEIEIAIISDGTRRLVGQVVPAQVGTVELHFGEESTSTESDTLGRFSFEDVPLGPISLRLQLADGAIVQTAWTLV